MIVKKKRTLVVIKRVSLLYSPSEGGGTADGAKLVDGASAPVVVFDDGAIELADGAIDSAVVFSDDVVFAAAADVIFDKCGFTVFGIPHIFDSVVFTGLRFDEGLLGLHIASFCSGVNDVIFTWP
jgi:hypothetical protein